MGKIVGFLRRLGVGIGKRSLTTLMPAIIDAVADEEKKEKRSGDKRRSVAKRIAKEAANLGLTLAGPEINLMIEIALLAIRNHKRLK